MELIVILFSVCSIIWFIIDRFKPIWEVYDFGKYITIAVSAGLSFWTCWGLELDLLFALSITAAVGPIGIVLTSLAFMTGASMLAELIGRLQGKQFDQTIKTTEIFNRLHPKENEKKQ